jgi:hypothetical protein
MAVVVNCGHFDQPFGNRELLCHLLGFSGWIEVKVADWRLQTSHL